MSALVKALKAGRDAPRKFIESAEFNPNEVDSKTGDTALHILVKQECNDLLKVVFTKTYSEEDQKPNVEQKNLEGKTPLATALIMGNEDAAVTLLNYGAKADALYDKESMLMLAASVKKGKIATQLISKGADPNYTNKNGSAVHYSIEADNEYLLGELLANSNTDLSLKNSKKQNPLHIAVIRNAVNILPNLLEAIKSKSLQEVFTARDEEGRCPVHIAARNFRQNIVNLLTKTAQEVGVQEVVTDSEGRSAEDVMRAVEDEKREALRAKEREIEQAKAKKAEERLASKIQAEKEREVEKKIEDHKRLKELQKETDKEEAKKRAPFVLLMCIAITVLGLYFLLKIGVATGATQRAAKTIPEDSPFPDL